MASEVCGRCGARGEPARASGRGVSLSPARTLRVDVRSTEQIDDLRWRGARRDQLTTLCQEIEDEGFLEE